MHTFSSTVVINSTYTGALTANALNSVIAHTTFHSVFCAGVVSASGAPASRSVTVIVCVVPHFEINVASVPLVAAPYVGTTSTTRHAPNVALATGVNATRISTWLSLAAAHVKTPVPAAAATASKSQSLWYAGTRVVVPKTTTGITGTAPWPLYAGQDVTVSGEFNSEKVVTLCAVLPHGVFHGQNVGVELKGVSWR